MHTKAKYENVIDERSNKHDNGYVLPPEPAPERAWST